MAASSEISKPTTFHLRSASLPSTSHPLVAIVEDQLCRLGATSQSTCYRLGGLKDLYESVDDMLQLPLTRDTNKEVVNAMLDGSLRLLDVCGTTRDVFSQIKGSIQELESSIRRSRGEESNIENEVKAYMVSRKRLCKVISKCLASSKKRAEKYCKAETILADLLRQVEEISIAIFESLLSQISPKARSRPTRWSLVSKLVKPRQVSNEERSDASEMEEMDAELLSLVGKKSIPVKVQNALKELEALESTIQEAEEELECVYRRLLKARVSLLNLLHH